MSTKTSKHSDSPANKDSVQTKYRSRKRTHKQTSVSRIGDDIATSQRMCPECETSDELRTDGEETYCEACGLVVATDDLDRSRTWVDTHDGSEPKRGGNAITLWRHDKGLSTDIGHYKDGHGNTLSSETRRKFHRLRRWDSQSKTPTTRDKSLQTGLGEIGRLVSALELSDTIRDRAVAIYREAASVDLLKGRSVEAIASGSVFAACRLERLPRHLGEITAVARCDETSLKSAYKTLNNTLNLATPPPLPQDFIPRLASAVNADPRLERRARQLATAPAVGSLVSGRSPVGVAAGCLYFAHRESDNRPQRITQTDLSEEGDISPITIRSMYRELETLAESGDLPAPDGNIEDFLTE